MLITDNTPQYTGKNLNENLLSVGQIIKSSQFTCITYQLERDIDGVYSIDRHSRFPRIAFAASPMIYRDNYGCTHEIIHSEYAPELADHRFAVVGKLQLDHQAYPKYTLLDLVTRKSYFMFLTPDIRIRYLSGEYSLSATFT